MITALFVMELIQILSSTQKFSHFSSFTITYFLFTYERENKTQTHEWNIREEQKCSFHIFEKFNVTFMRK